MCLKVGQDGGGVDGVLLNGVVSKGLMQPEMDNRDVLALLNELIVEDATTAP